MGMEMGPEWDFWMRRGKVDVHVVGMECTTFQELPNPG